MKTISFETFREFDAYERSNLTQNEPSCFNGMVRVTKIRITVEDVDESEDVIRARIKALWDACDNHHHRWPLRQIAEKYGLKLV